MIALTAWQNSMPRAQEKVKYASEATISEPQSAAAQTWPLLGVGGAIPRWRGRSTDEDFGPVY